MRWDRLTAAIVREAGRGPDPAAGPRDAEQGAVSVRARGIQKDLGAMPVGEFVAAVGEEIASKGKVTVVERFGVEVG